MQVTIYQRGQTCLKENMDIGDTVNVSNPDDNSPFMIMKLISRGWFKWGWFARPELVITMRSEKERLIG